MNIEQLYKSFEAKHKDIRVGAGASSLVKFDNEWIFIIDAEKRWAFNEKQEAIISFGCAGGTVEHGEKIIDAVHRETMEEIGTTIQIKDAETTQYLDEKGGISTISLQDDFRPRVIYEHRFASPDKGASIYLIFVYNSVALEEPRPSSEIPAIFSTDLKGFRKLADSIPLRYLHNNYDVKTQRSIPKNGILFPFMTPKMLFSNFGESLTQIFS